MRRRCTLPTSAIWTTFRKISCTEGGRRTAGKLLCLTLIWLQSMGGLPSTCLDNRKYPMRGWDDRDTWEAKAKRVRHFSSEIITLRIRCTVDRCHQPFEKGGRLMFCPQMEHKWRYMTLLTGFLDKLASHASAGFEGCPLPRTHNDTHHPLIGLGETQLRCPFEDDLRRMAK